MANELIIEKLSGIEAKYKEIEQELSNPEIVNDQKKYVQLNKDYRNLEPIIIAFREYKKMLEDLKSAKEVLNNEKDEDFREMAKQEIEGLTPQIETKEEEIKLLLLPQDPEDEKNAIVEIRAGTGGDEAAIFAGDLFRMYSRYCENKRWKIELTNFTESEAGGYKEIIFNVEGEGVYGLLKFEAGVHRVQRVPKTESQGRIHTSAATVAVFPEAEDFDVELREEDIRKDTFCSSGPGGQSVNTTYSAIRLTHIPTGIVVSCQDEKSQIKNLKAAMKELKARLYNLEYQKKMEEQTSKRRTMVSTGDRSAKIRTYNYPQGRVTDHRINLTLYNLPEIMNGNIDELIEKLQIEENAEKLKEAAL